MRYLYIKTNNNSYFKILCPCLWLIRITHLNNLFFSLESEESVYESASQRVKLNGNG